MDKRDFIKIEKDGITFLACGKYYEGNHRYVSHLLKDGDKDGIKYAAERMAKLVPHDPNIVLVPIPGHSGIAKQTYELACAIGKITNHKVICALQGNNRESLYSCKKEGRILSEEEMGFRKITSIDHNARVILVDNTVDYGVTAKYASKVMNCNQIITFSITSNIDCKFGELLFSSTHIKR